MEKEGNEERFPGSLNALGVGRSIQMVKTPAKRHDGACFFRRNVMWRRNFPILILEP